MRTSENINELAAALAKAQKVMRNAPKESTGNFGKYSDLATLRDAITPALTENNIAVVQVPVTTDGRLLLVTRLIHQTGQWIEGDYPIPLSDKPHVMGSAITYGRRYSLAAIVNLGADEDDDGQAAQDHHGKKGARDPDVRDMTGNPDAKHYKSNGTTAKALEARGNNEFFSKCQTEIRQAQTPEALREWAALHKAEISQKLSPAAVETLQEVYENHKADLLARMPA